MFFSNVSHEFRTPLTLILGPIEDAVAGGQGLSTDKLDLVRRNALRLHRMVNALLDFSRIEAGRAQATFVPTDLSTFTRELVGAFQSAIESAGLTMVVDCPPLPEAIYVDPDMWEKVVFNLLSNAVKYTHRGHIRVAMRWQDAHPILTVADTGVGIPEEELPRIFERFHRVRGTLGRSHEGTGIGLALVHELTKLHGGSVTVESRVGQGTTLTLQLRSGSAHLASEHVVHTPRPRSSAGGAAPFIEEARRWFGTEEAEPTPAHPPESVPERAIDIRSARILLADDNPDLRSYVTGILKRVFSNVETAADGQEALEKARTWLPDLVLSDVMMPRLDGFALVRELRQDARTRAVPIILLSARAGEEATVEGLVSGADDYLVKPFSSRELLARVETHLEMARIRRKAAQQELAEQELRQAITMRDEFLTVASHELLTPLTTLGMQVDSLLKTVREAPTGQVPAEGLAAKLDRARRQTIRLEELVDSLLDASRLGVGPTRMGVEETDLAAIVQGVVGRFADEATRAQTVITLHAVPALGSWHRERVEQLLAHLLKNALKFGGGKPIDVRIVSGRRMARLVVRDQGIGIAANLQDRIFNRLERGVPVKHYGGLGLGLWIVRRLAEAMNGTVRVESQAGKGATFTVELPTAQ